MSYYIRAFCASEKIPTIREILDWASEQGYKLEVSGECIDLDINSRDWKYVDIIYKSGKLPFLSEVNRDEGTEDCLMREEIEEFKDFLSDIRSRGKKKVLKHLEETKYIVANQIPTSNFDDDGYNANGVFLDYFVQHCGGMVQADGEGFYKGQKLIIEFE